MKKVYSLLLMLAVATTAVAQQTEDINGGTALQAESPTAATALAGTEQTGQTITEQTGQSITERTVQSGAEQTAQSEPVATQSVEPTPNEARRQRGFSTDSCFVPKGQWVFGGTASYSVHRNDDYKFLIIDNINSEGYTLKVSPMIAIAPCKNMTVGVRFGYGRSMLAVDSGSLSFGEGDTGVNINVDYYHQIKHNYTGTLFWRPYIPLGRSNRFAIFAEVQLNVSGGQSKLVAANGEVAGIPDYRGSYSESLGASIALQPGIVAFITNNTALELSIGVFGIGYDRTTQLRNQVDEGMMESTDINFNINLLSIGFGFAFYL